MKYQNYQKLIHELIHQAASRPAAIFPLYSGAGGGNGGGGECALNAWDEGPVAVRK